MTKSLPAWVKIAKSSCSIKFANSQFHTSSGIRVSQQRLRGTRWVGQMTTPYLSPAQHRELSAWINDIVDLNDSFYAYDPDHRTPRGGASGAGAVNGASQTGRTLNTKLWPVSTVIFEAGDYIQAGSQMFEVKSQVTSDGSGLAAIPIQPAIRLSPVNSSLITYVNPVCIANITSGNVFETDHSKGGPISFSWEEKL